MASKSNKLAVQLKLDSVYCAALSLHQLCPSTQFRVLVQQVIANLLDITKFALGSL